MGTYERARHLVRPRQPALATSGKIPPLHEIGSQDTCPWTQKWSVDHMETTHSGWWGVQGPQRAWCCTAAGSTQAPLWDIAFPRALQTSSINIPPPSSATAPAEDSPALLMQDKQNWPSVRALWEEVSHQVCLAASGEGYRVFLRSVNRSPQVLVLRKEGVLEGKTSGKLEWSN